MEAAASASSPPSPPASHPRENITIDVLPANVSWPSEDVGMIPGPSPTSHDPSSSGTTLNTPRPLRVINPTVTFKSATPLTAQSVFKVFHNGTIVHTETTEFQLCSSSCLPQSPWSSQVECSFLYSTTLVPQYWQRLCESLDLNPYTIEQDVVTSSDTSSSESPSPSDPTRTLLSVVYSFNMYKSSGSTPPQSPISTSSAGGSVHADALSFTAESTPEHTEYDMFMMNSLSNQSLPTYAPLHTQTLPQMAPGAYEPPELVQDGEEGYASLPPSPLDFTFATSLTSGLAADPASALSQTLCPGYAEDERVVSSGQHHHHHHHHQHTAPYIHDGVGVNGVDVGVSSSMLNGIPYVSSLSDAPPCLGL
ncbi:hypothetical protein K474DRAFT_475719 [Panus rudis PR-1116 ss-1]|nr:hypothetical protein K474DRAFT_475719 [Panus rudis PR-1116 ss-1]